MKTHFASALPRKCFCRCWQYFMLRTSAFTWATSAKTSTRSKLDRFTPYFTKNKKYYVCNSIQNFKRSLVYIQSKAPSSICSSIRNDNPFHLHDNRLIIIDLLRIARCYQLDRKQGCVPSSSEVSSIPFIKEVSCKLNCFTES